MSSFVELLTETVPSSVTVVREDIIMAGHRNATAKLLLGDKICTCKIHY